MTVPDTLQYLLLMVLATVLVCGGCITGSSNTPVDSGTGDTDADTDTDTGEDPLSRIAVSCAAGSGHTCALTAAGGVKCWGMNNYGQVGAFPSAASYTPPDQAEPLHEGVVDICAESWNTCALMEDGGVKCWGDNLYGQLGNGSMGGGYEYVPDDVIGLGGKAVQVECGMQFACALLENGKIMCWGNGGSGQLGNGVDLDLCVDWYSCIQPEPAEVVDLGMTVDSLAVGLSITCSSAVNGNLECWGTGSPLGGGGPDPLSSSVPLEVISFSSQVSQVELSTHACVLTEDGSFFSWGSNSDGEVGNGAVEYAQWEPVEIGPFTPRPTNIECDGKHTCISLEDGSVKCWGRNKYGQLGNGEWGHDVISSTPVDVIGLENHFVVSLCGGSNTCAIMDDGSMKCWGRGSSGQLGNDIDVTTCQEWDDCIFPEPVDVLGFGPEYITP